MKRTERGGEPVFDPELREDPWRSGDRFYHLRPHDRPGTVITASRSGSNAIAGDHENTGAELNSRRSRPPDWSFQAGFRVTAQGSRKTACFGKRGYPTAGLSLRPRRSDARPVRRRPSTVLIACRRARLRNGLIVSNAGRVKPVQSSITATGTIKCCSFSAYSYLY